MTRVRMIWMINTLSLIVVFSVLNTRLSSCCAVSALRSSDAWEINLCEIPGNSRRESRKSDSHEFPNGNSR